MPMGEMKYVLWPVAMVAVVFIVWYFWGSKGTPHGQPPLASLTTKNFEKFTGDFNAASGELRLVLLFSPT